MAEFASLPLFTDAITADCSHLDDCEFGLYVRLLILIWRSPDCRIPRDPAWVARKLKRDFHKIEPLINEFISTDGNYWFQKRLMKEFKYTREKSKKNTVSAKSRWIKEKQSTKRNATTPNPGIAPTPTPTPTPTIEKVVTNVTTKKKITIEELSITHIQDWLSQKRAIGKYLAVDEFAHLEYFKDYCRSKNTGYKDFIAAFRNSFNWTNALTKGKINGTNINGYKPNKSERARAAGQRALAAFGITEESQADREDGEPMFRQLEYLREGT